MDTSQIPFSVNPWANGQSIDTHCGQGDISTLCSDLLDRWLREAMVWEMEVLLMKTWSMNPNPGLNPILYFQHKDG